MSSRYWLLFALLLPLQVFAQSAGKITFVEGKLRVIRNASILQGAQGVAIEVADIVETSKPGFALMEFPDGTVIALGDATRVMLSSFPQAGKAGTGPELLLLEGWLKGQSRLADSATAFSVLSPTQSVSWKTSSLIVHGAASSGEVFVESGSAMIGITDKRGRSANMVASKAGQFVSRAGDKLAVPQLRPTEPFLDGVPSAFKDALPSRLDRFKDKNVEAKAAGEVAYADVADWLSASQSWRAGFVKRFEPRLADPAFRQQLAARLKSHPEWDKALHPPKSN